MTLSLSHDRITLREMTPRLSCSYQDQNSNVALYAFESIDCTMSLQHRF